MSALKMIAACAEAQYRGLTPAQREILRTTPVQYFMGYEVEEKVATIWAVSRGAYPLDPALGLISVKYHVWKE